MSDAPHSTGPARRWHREGPPPPASPEDLADLQARLTGRRNGTHAPQGEALAAAAKDRPAPPAGDAPRAVWAVYYQALGFALCAIPPGSKGPRSPGWPEHPLPAEHWDVHPEEGIGAILGRSRLVSLDLDGLEPARELLAELGLDLDALTAGAVLVRGRPDRLRALYRAPAGVELSRRALAWPAREPGGKPMTVFELRAGAVQDVLPPTIHPDTREPYAWLRAPWEVARLGALPPELVELWTGWDAWRPMLEALCPWGAREEPAPAPRGPGARVDVIGAFNQAHDVRALLEAHGYRPKGAKRWLAPSSESGDPGVVLLRSGRVYSHHGADPLAIGHALDPFEVFTRLEHAGDTRAAVRAAAEALGLTDREHPRERATRKGTAPATAGAAVDPGPIPVLVTVAEVKAEPIRWLWPGRFVLGKVSLLAGDPGLGKSLVSLAVVAAVTRGARWPVDGTPAPEGEAVLLSAEDDVADTIRPRLEASGADVSRVHVLTMVRDLDSDGRPFSRGFSLRRDLELLAAILAERPAVRLVVVDPISAYLGDTDSHNNADVRGLLAPLAELAARHRVAVLGVSHLNKSNGPAMYRTSGSLAFVAAARAVFAVTKDRDAPTRRLVLPVKNNLAPDATGLAYTIGTGENAAPVVLWEPEAVTVTAEEALAPAVSDDDRSELADAKEWLREMLANGPVRADELQRDAKGAGHAWRTLNRAKAVLRVRSAKGSFSGKWTWELPAEGCQPRMPTGEDLASFDETRAPLGFAPRSSTEGCQGCQAEETWHPSRGDRPPKDANSPKDANPQALGILRESEAPKPAPRLGSAEGCQPVELGTLRGTLRAPPGEAPTDPAEAWEEGEA